MAAARTTWAPLATVIVAGLLPLFLGCESEILRTAIRENVAKSVKEIKASPSVKLDTYVDQKKWAGELNEDEVKRLIAIIEAGKPDTNPAKYEGTGTISYQLPNGTTKELSLYSIGPFEGCLRIDAANYWRGLNQAELDQLVKDIASRTSR